MRTIFIDAFSGASGDMILGALVDAGGDFDGLRAALAPLARGRFELRRRRVVSSSLAATRIEVKITTKDEEERNYREIASLVRRGKLSGPVRDLALEIFRRLCEAEARVHGVPFDRVHLHEAGAVDAIADICGAAWLFHALGPARIVCSPLNVGSGTIECRHGTYPVPGPATARLLRGVPVYAEGAPGERVTPTGAAILTTVVSEFRPLPPMVARSIGHGAGERAFEDRPNVLRVIVGEELTDAIDLDFEDTGVIASASARGRKGQRRPLDIAGRPSSARVTAADSVPEARSIVAGAGLPIGLANVPPRALEGATFSLRSPDGSGGRENRRRTPAHAGEGDVLVIETTIDDMNPQNYSFLLEKALSAGALEVYFTPVLMKKGRPGMQVTAIVPPAGFEAISQLIFRETTTIGFRYRRESRRELDRAMTKVETPYGEVRLKVSHDKGVILQVQPEYEDCRRLAEARNVPLKEVQRAALAAWRPARTALRTAAPRTAAVRRARRAAGSTVARAKKKAARGPIVSRRAAKGAIVVAAPRTAARKASTP